MQPILVKGSKRERKLQLAVVCSAVVWLLLSFQLLTWRVEDNARFPSPVSVRCCTPRLKVGLCLHESHVLGKQSCSFSLFT